MELNIHKIKNIVIFTNINYLLEIISICNNIKKKKCLVLKVSL